MLASIHCRIRPETPASLDTILRSRRLVPFPQETEPEVLRLAAEREN